MTGPKFQKAQTVLLRSTRESGRVETDGELDGGEYWYQVRFDRRLDNVVEEELVALDAPNETVQSLVLKGHWGTVQAFRTALAVERITHSNQSTVYSYRASRILFEPYQYKPLLKLLDSPDRRILIADEVGLGKTIEAGLILTEFEARRPLERVLIVCPSRLREKWREELNRKFGQDFEIYDRKGLRAYLQRIKQNPGRGRLRAIVSIQTLRNQELRDQFNAEIPQIEMIVVDEAHHARNPESLASGLLSDLARLGDALILLTATPLQLRTRDLYTLLNALRPTEFRDSDVFERQLRAHQGVLRSAAIIRTRDAARLPEVAKRLRAIFHKRFSSTSGDPRVDPLIRELEQEPPSDQRAWVDLERRVQELHPLSTILTRTRKRDVKEHAPTRRATVWKCRWSDAENVAYTKLIEGASSGGWITNRMSLGQLQRARQAASCLPAALTAHSVATDDDDAVELTDIAPSDVGELSPNTSTSPIPSIASPDDSKFQMLREIINEIRRDEPHFKVLIFTFFKGTARYLEQRLRELNVASLRIDGDIPSSPLQPERDERAIRMRQFREDSNIHVLVSTEVGSEGLDFQFCHHLVNYDLPWNPMVVEQRIGRIDRFGQQSPVVHIHNLVVEGSVEDRILHRLYDRIRIFEESIGDLESILGKEMQNLQRDYVSGVLTPEEADRRVELAARAIENNRTELEALEKSSTELFGHEEYIRDELQRIGRLGRYVTESSLLALLTAWLHRRHPDCQLWQEPKQNKTHYLRINEALRRDLQDTTTDRSLPSRSSSLPLRLTADGDLAFRDSSLELLNVSHPLIKAAVMGLREQLSEPNSRVGKALLTTEQASEFKCGRYLVAVWAHTLNGIRKRTLIEPVAFSIERGQILDPEDSERLLFLVLEAGQEWTGGELSGFEEASWKKMISVARLRNQELRRREQRENETAYFRRKQVLDDEFQLQTEGINTRINTARTNNRDERIVRLFEAQLAKAESRHRELVRELDGNRNASVLFSDVLAACLVAVTSHQGTI